jgi:hypothetical protein
MKDRSSAELAAAVTGDRRLQPLGRYRLRGVREERQVYALDLGGEEPEV